MTTMTYTGTLTVLHCGKCQIRFAVPESFDRRNHETGDTWYCPAGHPRVYRDTDVDKLRREAEDLRRQRDAARVSRDAARDQAETAERRRRAAKGQLTKVKNRVANGVCPCCNRTFADLARHMETKHPGFVAVAGERT